MQPVKLLALLAGLSVVALGQKPYTCGTCHTKEAASQPKTPMGRALLSPDANAALRSHPSLNFTLGRFRYLIETRGNGSTYSVSDGEKTISVPIEWTFGAGAQTFVMKRGEAFVEGLVSYYPEIGGLDVTIGDQALAPKNLEEAFGRPLASAEVTACFGCHATGAVSDGKLNLASLQRGVTCEHCHAGAASHLNTISQPAAHRDWKATIPSRLGKQSSESLSNFCGGCHRSWETVVRNNWNGEINVRFQPYRLANSKCFDGTDSRISCVGCHNPHEDLARNDKQYDPKCLACHSSAEEPHNAAMKTAGKSCPVSKENCVSCHMPKVRLPGGHQTFTDHQIRVVKAGEPYPN